MPENTDRKVREEGTLPGSETPTDVRQRIRTSLDPITTKHKSSLVGKTVGGVGLDAYIGKGGMSEVYHGVLGDQEVAVKVLQLGHMKSESVIRRFEEDAKATAILRHPNIVETIKSGIDEGTP